MKVWRKWKSGFVRGVNTRKVLPAIACRTFLQPGISKLPFNAPADRKPPLHLSQIIHIDRLYGPDTNELRNKKTGVERPFFIGFHRF